jgi:type IV secretion system protein VirD4
MRRVLLILGCAAALWLPVAAQFDYLAEMPTVAAVKEAFADPDPLQAAGKQIAAFAELQDVGRTFIGRFDALTQSARLRPAERELFEGYRAAIREIRATPGLDVDEATNLAMRISMSVRKEVLQRFFSVASQAEYAKASTAFEAHLREEREKDAREAEARRPPPVRPPDSTGTTDDDDPGAGQIATNWMWQLIYVGTPIVAFLLWRKLQFNENAEIAANSKAELERLGATVDARTSRIDQMFTQRSESLLFDLKSKTPQKQFFTAKMTRSIAAMAVRERETLRTLYQLFNSGFVTDKNFYWARLALIYGDGKAQLLEGQVTTAALKALTGMTSESAVSLVLDWAGRAATAHPDHPVAKQIAERMFGGGAASLSSSTAFVAAEGTRPPVLVLGLADDTGALVTYGGEGAAFTVAPPRSGKSVSQVIPTLLSWNGPAVVLDIKSEIYDETSKWRSEHVGPVYRFAPLDPANSHRYNPLLAVRSDPEFIWEDARFLADMMMVPTEAKDPFWQDSARDLLTAAIARACASDDPQARTISSVLDVFHGVGWDAFIADLQARTDIRSMVRAASSLGEMDRKTRDGVLKTGLTSLSAWDGERIERMTRASDWSPLDLRTGENPTIYICLGANEVKSYLSMLRVLLAQHIRSLTAKLPPRGATPILFVLDELPQLRHMPPVEEALNVGAGFGIRLWMFAQSVGQMKEAYPNADGMIGACALRMFMNPSLHDGTAQKLSDDIGFQEGVLDGQRQKIVEAPDLAGPDYKDHVIVMASGFKPFRLRKNFVFLNPELKARQGRRA